LFATAFAVLGTLFTLRLAREDWLSSFNIAVAMNARGGPLIVLATVTFELGIINQIFFVTLVLIALATSLLAGSWFRYVISMGWPLLNSRGSERLALTAKEQSELLASGVPVSQDSQP
jgi:Kef-type K+ transport system membrane component KefB